MWLTHSITSSLSQCVYLSVSSTVSTEKLSSGHSQDVFPFQRSLLTGWTAGQWFPNTASSSLCSGTTDPKSRSLFPRRSILHVAHTGKYHPPTKAAAVPVYNMTKASQIKWRMTKGREKRRMFRSNIPRELLCLPVWAYYSMVGKAWKQHQPNKAHWKVVLYSSRASSSSLPFEMCN